MRHEHASMNDLPRHTLSRIIAEHGRGICDAPKRIEALLRDLCGAHRREINIIVGALEERVASDLIARGNSVPRDVLLARLAARLRDNLAYTPEAARWGVETWAVALGILSEAELPARQPSESGEAHLIDAPSPVRESKPSGASAASVSPPAPQAQRGTTSTPPPRGTTSAPPPLPSPSSKTSPSTSSARPSVHVPAPRRTTIVHPNVSMPETLQQNVPPPTISRPISRRGLKLRGCLVVAVLVIVLVVAAVFVVPAVIFILREEQSRPSINEPRVR